MNSEQYQSQLFKMKPDLRLTGGTQSVKTVIKYILTNMGYRYKENCVVYYPLSKKSKVYFKDVHIVTVDKKNQVVIIPFNPEIRTKYVKELLNRILMQFCGVNLFQKNRNWFIVKQYERDFKIDRDISIPFIIDKRHLSVKA